MIIVKTSERCEKINLSVVAMERIVRRSDILFIIVPYSVRFTVSYENDRGRNARNRKCPRSKFQPIRSYGNIVEHFRKFESKNLYSCCMKNNNLDGNSCGYFSFVDTFQSNVLYF